MDGRTLEVVRLGLCAYDDAFALQRELHAQLVANPVAHDRLILVEHPPVITLGRRANRAHVLLSAEELVRRGIQLREVDRGGDVTYHGPGQLVAYPIMRLTGARRDVGDYFRSLEEVVIRLLGEYGIEAGRQPGLTGVWIGDDKICAMGVAIKRWVTYHGLALNVDPNLAHFRLITPCGIADKGVTSMAKLLGRSVAVADVADRLVARFASEFEFPDVVP